MSSLLYLKPPLRCPACQQTLNRKLKHCETQGCSWLWCNNCKALVGPYGFHTKGA